jgi:putative ABC transport system permease protein
MNVIGSVDSVGRDLRYALRGLARRPAFTFAAVVTLALGIGATTAIFSVVYSVLIKPLPYPNADELVRIRHSFGGELGGADFEPTMYFTYKDENRAFATVGLWQDGATTLTDGGESERLRALLMTDGTLQALGVPPLRGRWFTEGEYGTAAERPRPVILSHAFWQRRFGADEAAIGRQLSLDSQPAEVVGIMPPDFRFLDLTPQPDVIVAVRLASRAEQAIAGNINYQGIARLKAGVTPVEAHADVERMLRIWREAWPLRTGLTRETLENLRIAPVIRSLKDDLVGDVASMLWVLMGAIGAVLLVACANIANLMLVRADAREQEFAVRSALGAVPARIARALLAESLVIGAAGSALGLTLAYGGLELLVAMGPSNLPRLQAIAVYPPVLAFTVAVSLASTLAFGSVTILKQARHIGTPMTLVARGSTASPARSKTRNGLVVVQVALALVLVVSAALMIRTFQALRDVDPGFSEPATIQTARIWIPNVLASDPAAYTRMQHEMLDRIEAIPGVASAGFASALPMEAPPISPPILVEGETLAPGGIPPFRSIKFVSPGYAEAMGTRIVAGRDVTWSDIEAGGRVALISERFARELATEPADAVGKRIRTMVPMDAWREVIGVVQSVHEAGLYEEAPSFVYWPVLVENMYGAPLLGTSAAVFVIRSERAGTASLTEEIRQAIRSVNGSIPITAERTMEDVYAGSLARTSFVLVMLAIAASMALLLGVIGIYGVIAYVISQRMREIGIRSALGAEPQQLKKMFLLNGLALSAVGVLVGLVVAAALSRAMSSLLFGIEPMDPAAYMVAIGVILASAVLASYLPARRAATIDPIQTLRAE